MPKYTLSNKAVDDLSSIWLYTYKTWSESQADKYYNLLTSSFIEILQNPQLGKHYAEIDPSIFGLSVGKHVIFYRVLKAGDIEVIRILHQRMDMKSRIDE